MHVVAIVSNNRKAFFFLGEGPCGNQRSVALFSSNSLPGLLKKGRLPFRAARRFFGIFPLFFRGLKERPRGKTKTPEPFVGGPGKRDTL